MVGFAIALPTLHNTLIFQLLKYLCLTMRVFPLALHVQPLSGLLPQISPLALHIQPLSGLANNHFVPHSIGKRYIPKTYAITVISPLDLLVTNFGNKNFF